MTLFLILLHNLYIINSMIILCVCVHLYVHNIMDNNKFIDITQKKAGEISNTSIRLISDNGY